jgi:polyphenol oxidase
MSGGDPGDGHVSGGDPARHATGLLFELPGTGRALFTTRAEGNMSSVGGIEHEHGARARARVRAQHRLHGLVRGYQVHGTTVLVARSSADVTQHDQEQSRPPAQADGHATSLSRVGVMVLAADCLPVALGSGHAVAMVHAGWRGLAAGVLEQGVRVLRELDRDGAEQIVAIVGPGAGPCCYEVGEEVHAAFAGAHRDGRRIDLQAIARDRLQAAGVSEVRDVRACTICDERFFSHRRESTDAGRQAGVAWLSPSP